MERKIPIPFNFKTMEILALGAAFLYLLARLTSEPSYLPLAILPILLGLAFFFYLSRRPKSEENFNKTLNALVLVGALYAVFLLFSLKLGTYPFFNSPIWDKKIFLFGNARGVFFLTILLLNHLAWLKSHWTFRADAGRGFISFFLFLSLITIASVYSWLLFPPFLLLYLLLLPSKQRGRTLITFLPPLLAALFITPGFVLALEARDIVFALLWLGLGGSLTMVGYILASKINALSANQKTFFFVVCLASFILLSSVFFYGFMLQTSSPEEGGETIIVLPEALQQLPIDSVPERVTLREGVLASVVVTILFFAFIKKKIIKLRETKASQKAIPAGLIVISLLLAVHIILAPSLIIGAPAPIIWGILSLDLSFEGNNLKE